MSDFQRIHRQFATHNNRRSANLYPSLVERGFMNQGVRVILGFLMVRGIEEFDDLTVFEDRVGDPDFVAKTLCDSLRDG